MDLGRKTCRALRGGVSLNDVLSVLFYGPGSPTFAQAQAFVDAAIANLCPGCIVTAGDDKLQYGEPVRARENAKRQDVAAQLGGLVGPRVEPFGGFGGMQQIARNLFGPRR